MEILSPNFLESKSSRTGIILFPIEMPYLTAPIISAASTAMVLIVCLVSRSYKDPLGAMIMWINFADFAFCMSKTVGSVFNILDSNTCLVLQITAQFGLISSVLWSALFAHALLAATRHQESQIIMKNNKFYIIFAVGLPIIMSVSIIHWKFVEFSDRSCIHEVNSGQPDYSHIFLTVFPVLVSCFLSIAWYIKAACRIKSIISREDSMELLTLIVYPAILLICWLPTLMVNLCLTLGCDITPTWIKIAQAVDQSQGFLDAMVYGGTKNILRQVCKWRCKVKKVRSVKSSMQGLIQVTSSESDDTNRMEDDLVQIKRSK